MASDTAGVCRIEDIPLQSEVEISTTSKHSDPIEVLVPTTGNINQKASPNSVSKISDKQQQISAVIDGKIVESSLKVDINGQTFHIFSPKADKKQIISSPGSVSDVTSHQHGNDQNEVRISSADHGYQVSERKKRSANKKVKPSTGDNEVEIASKEPTTVEAPYIEIVPQKKEKFVSSGLKASDLKIKIKTNRKAREDLEELKRLEKQRKKASKQNKCQHCKKMFENNGELNKHLILKHGAKPVSPLATGSYSRSKITKSPETKLHQVITPDQLYGVPVPQSSQDTAKKHVCSICDKFYYLESNLERHMLRDHFGETYMQEYGQVDETKSHDFGYSVDSSDDDTVIAKREVKDYKAMHRQLYFKYNCEICDYKSHYKHNFERHMNLNHGDYGETCNICKISFTSKAQLDNHNKNMHSHTSEKKLRSHVSKTKESTESVLPPEKKRKIYTATYRCEHCNEVFSSLSDLEDHMDYHYAPAVFE